MSLYERFSRLPEWESAIGRLMMASAKLEMNVLMAISNYGGLDLARRVFKSGHAARLKVLQDLASDRDERTRVSVGSIIELLREFNKQRNQVAHNPLMYALDKDSTDSHMYGAIFDMADPERSIGLDEITALAERGEDLSSHFTFTWMMVMGVPK